MVSWLSCWVSLRIVFDLTCYTFGGSLSSVESPLFITFFSFPVVVLFSSTSFMSREISQNMVPSQRYICPRHAGRGQADGYAQATGRVGLPEEGFRSISSNSPPPRRIVKYLLDSGASFTCLIVWGLVLLRSQARLLLRFMVYFSNFVVIPPMMQALSQEKPSNRKTATASYPLRALWR